ncbi:TIGR01212 family radical SAM protein [Petrocella sp. FN5]|uniref:TIGR01212 family radical SAM protein n=1 Tax=Petrocella sp. FN5 TaxID=3032002 RepID=UPI0023DAB15C|nr:TIGR01212 family radical SAM protein [Petrocella sp. FN5]MDF1616317.1 TIGR01212 family radical SAM protein [Petrocella sp. FN5]
MKTLYNIYSQYLKKEYGEKVYKLPINLPITCPNRDGTLGSQGCYFCSEKGAGFEALPSTQSVATQLRSNMKYIGKRYGAKQFIAYFQNYTNTYMAYEVFNAYIQSACIENIVEIDIATRPDCISREHLEILKNIRDTYDVEIVIELGLQTTNDDTLKQINRGHDVMSYINATQLIHEYGFKVCTHLIMNLPWDEDDEVIQMALLMNQLEVEMVKLHALYIAKETVFEDMYNQGLFKMNTMENYIERVVSFLTYLNPNCAVQRLVSRAPKEDTVFCNWNTSWWIIKESIEKKC